MTKLNSFYLLFLVVDYFVNHTSMYETSELNVFIKTEFVGEISNKLPNGLLGTNVYKTLKSCL